LQSGTAQRSVYGIAAGFKITTPQRRAIAVVVPLACLKLNASQPFWITLTFTVEKAVKLQILTL
jgi:hypothetical protein